MNYISILLLYILFLSKYDIDRIRLCDAVPLKLKDATRYNKGRIGLVNVFSPKILKCARCNSGMIIISKAKNEKCIKCKSYNDGLGCTNTFGYPYDDMEKSFFSKALAIVDFPDPKNI
jgi:hypothetical protein